MTRLRLTDCISAIDSKLDARPRVTAERFEPGDGSAAWRVTGDGEAVLRVRIKGGVLIATVDGGQPVRSTLPGYTAEIAVRRVVGEVVG